ncbi:MAG: hypothetical protein JWL63_2621 [Rhodocyclales bacterium]|nr:hypothetical protein [Rhodocyclales bacterium]
MVTIMDMTSGTPPTDTERYGEEVLNANWLPQPALALGLQSVCASEASAPRTMLLTDIDSFMSRLYSSQE